MKSKCSISLLTVYSESNQNLMQTIKKKFEPSKVFNTWELKTKIGAISNQLGNITHTIKQFQEHKAVFACVDNVKMAPSALI